MVEDQLQLCRLLRKRISLLSQWSHEKFTSVFVYPFCEFFEDYDCYAVPYLPIDSRGLYRRRPPSETPSQKPIRTPERRMSIV